VQHEDGALGSVQTDRFVDLLEDKARWNSSSGDASALAPPAILIASG
jgi:hypothetical protein